MFTANYPNWRAGEAALLPTPERVGALPDYTGRGVTMAFLDSGFYMHPDLGDRILIHADATTRHVTEQPRITETDVTSWHGQMTTVIAAGNGRLSDGRYRGLAPDAKLVLVKVSNPRGWVKETDILRGLRWLYDVRARFNLRVVNVSVGGDRASSDPNHPLHIAVRKLVEAGVVVVIAAGNRAERWLLPPASSAEAITVGGYDDHNALNPDEWTAYNSNYGTAYDGTPKPDLVGPAQWLASPILPGSHVAREARWLGPLLSDQPEAALEYVRQFGGAELGLPTQADDRLGQFLQTRIHAHKLVSTYYQHVDGTSVAAPVVAAAVAQMLEANPTLTPLDVKQLLQSTARPLPSIAPERQGAGALDAGAAVRAAAAQRGGEQ